MLGFFRKKSIEDELKENPNQPQLWLKLADKNIKKFTEGIANAIHYSNGELVVEAATLLKEKISYRDVDIDTNLIEEKAGKYTAALISGILEKYENKNLSKARNLFETAYQSENKQEKFLAGFELSKLLIEEGFYDQAKKIISEIEPFTPESYKDELNELKKEIEKATEEKKGGIFKSFKEGLKKTREALNFSVFKGREVNEEFFEELEEKLILADIGVKTTLELIEELKREAKKKKIKESDKILELLKSRLKSILLKHKGELKIDHKPFVILVLGVNGVGKTTTIGKLAKQLKDEGKSVVLAAADTFRAAAIEQLEVWAQRSGARIIKGNEGADPASVVFDAVQSVKAKGDDVLIIDTAGRLHNKDRLMKEIQKIKKVVSKELPGEPSEILLVLDANTGQNAISQAKAFKEITDVTGIALTKLDGTAKGGIVIAISNELKIPIKYVGIGEKIEDLRKFNPEEFVEGLFS
ncbi:fused signal recognition particle receptor [Desulfurobacterium atlanticum]|uniref:Signal recognition particle receptor FtsY n=1 Tax=Desulfurobacterium atlanticum TaxID=240169 RepID=A0A238XNF5_9BACT|nr:signal recognition particle-docking protein FtsY [Desulfurobacterium atlanticum]SNR60108.1 fused signal recognition particle receptor [Desulfurobacterium atlanticum]